MIITRERLTKKEKAMPTNPDKPKWPDAYPINNFTELCNWHQRQCAVLESIHKVLAVILEELQRLNAERGVNPGGGGRGEERKNHLTSIK